MMTRHVALTLVLVVAALALGWWGRGLLTSEPPESDHEGRAAADAPCPDGARPLYWKAPMDPTYVRDAPGQSPMGMDLVPECPSASSRAPEGSVVIDPVTIQNIGVRTARVERRDLARSVRAVGRVAVDERRVAHVHTKVQGWVETLHVDFVGQRVERGAPMLEIYSPELVSTQEELLLAARYREATHESPFADVRGSGAALFEAAQRRLALWDVPERDVERLLETGEVKRTLTLYAPASGVVTSLGVRSGMEVKPNANLYTIANLSRVWVLADVYEYELPWLEIGQTATVELSYLPGEKMTGELTYIAPFLDPKTRTAEVRLELDNASGRLKPEMFGNAVIAGSPRPDVVAIQSEAVIRSGTRTLAVVALGEGRYAPRPIELGLDTGDGWLEVRSGLEAGQEVVVSSQFLIDSESNLQEAVRKLLATSDSEDAETMDHSSHDSNEHGAHHGGHEPEPKHSAHSEHSAHATGESAPDPHAGHSMHGTHDMPPAHDHSAMEQE